MNAIETDHLTKIYKKKVRALDGCSLTIPESCIFGLIGPNGAGKSTMMNIWAGILNRSDGSFSILGETVHKWDYECKRQIGFVLEKPHYIEKLTVEEYLHFCGAIYELGTETVKSRTNELLDFFDLGKKASDRIENCSTGLKKKVSLAATLIHRPKLLILDEPFEGIDPISVKQIKDNLRLMSEQGITIVLSSDNLDTVERLCDEVAIINKGEIIYQTKTDEIRAKVGFKKYNSLEDLFVELISEHDQNKKAGRLSWL